MECHVQRVLLWVPERTTGIKGRDEAEKNPLSGDFLPAFLVIIWSLF